jgi:hypothetical protein
MNEDFKVPVEELVNLGEINIEMEDQDSVETEMRTLITSTIIEKVFDFI